MLQTCVENKTVSYIYFHVLTENHMAVEIAIEQHCNISLIVRDRFPYRDRAQSTEYF